MTQDRGAGSGEPADTTVERGVFYSRDDHAGLWRRLVAGLVDVTVLLVAEVTITLATAIRRPAGDPAVPQVFFWSSIALGFLYLVLLKGSRLRTLGYMIGGVRIVNLQGERPSVWALAIRALFVVVGPLNLFIDMMWITSDERRQALRDKFARTYVIRSGAVPAGRGTIVYSNHTILAAHFRFAEVRPDT